MPLWIQHAVRAHSVNDNEIYFNVLFLVHFVAQKILLIIIVLLAKWDKKCHVSFSLEK